MIPIGDLNPTRRRAFITAAIVIASAWVFFGVQPHDLEGQARFLYAEATIPCEVVTAEPLSLGEIRTGSCERNDAAPAFADKSIALSLVASIFFHGSIGHLIGNLWILWIFGNNIEDSLGRFRYLWFYLATGLVATAAHVAMNPSSTVPVVGASGAIAGVMGAYLVFFPGARIRSIIPPLFFLPFDVPAIVFLVLWFVGQFALAGAETNIAWEAHVGGFLAGALYAAIRRRRVVRPRRR